MPFIIEVTYPTRLGNLAAQMTAKETVDSRPEAEEVRNAIRALPGFSDAEILIKNANPLPTVDEAMRKFMGSFSRYPVIGA